MDNRLRNILFATTAIIPLGMSGAHANPLGSQVVGGAATVQGQGTSSVTVTQSTDRAIINWNSFNIGTGQTTQFVQPGSTSVTLNRVTGGAGPSSLDGTLTANGRIFLVNPDGILFGANSKVNAAGFLATTNDIKNDDFMAGKYQFGIPGRSDASVVNLGTITAQSGGFAALVAPGVRNAGTITANLGSVGLAAGNGFTLDFYGDKLITLGVADVVASKVIDVATGQPLNALVKNEGKLKANGGRVELTAAAARQVVDSVINNSGVIEANSIGTKSGMIVLGAATADTKPAGTPTQTIKVSGKLSAAGKRAGASGGTIVVSGENIAVASATIDASGQAGGGKVLIGGDIGGGKGNGLVAGKTSAALETFKISNAANVSIDAASSINASAATAGNGGKVVVWADQTTTFYGTIKARGGAQSGDGGFVETSGHDGLTFNGTVDTGASSGKAGALLLDPLNVTIDVNAGNQVTTVASLQAALVNGSVFISTGTTGTDAGDITVAASVAWTGNNDLVFAAHRNIIINDGVTISNSGAGTLGMFAGADANANGMFGTGSGTVQFNGTAKADFSQSSGGLYLVYNPVGGYANATDFSTHFVGNPTSSAGHLLTLMWVNNVNDLQNINQNLSGNYVLANNIDASATAGWNSGAGFVPIGTAANPFIGSLLGGFTNGVLTIDHLTINSPASAVGLFGAIAMPATPGLGSLSYISDIALTNVSITGTSAGASVGALVGLNNGVVTQSYSSGTVTGAASSSTAPGAVGGLIGTQGSGGSVSTSFSQAAVSGGAFNAIGGLIGSNGGFVANSYATGVITAATSATAGGLIGTGSPTSVYQSYWDTQTSGQSTSAGGTGLTTTQFKSALPTGFDANTWSVSPSVNNGYPYFATQTSDIPGGGVTPTDPPPVQPPPPPIQTPDKDPPPVVIPPIVDLHTPLPVVTTQYIVGPTLPLTSDTMNSIVSTAVPAVTLASLNPSSPRTAPASPPRNVPVSSQQLAGPPPGVGIGRTLSEQTFSGVPPIGETRFVPNEVVLQVSVQVSRERIEAVARRLGLTVIASDTLGLSGRTAFRFGFDSKRDIRTLIKALEANQVVASASPNYRFELDQGVASINSSPAGDPSQYVIDKLSLNSVHRRALGDNVTVALVDSEIDIGHPDLTGVVVESFDATGTPSKPHLHGTGMAGAIASHQRLIGVAPKVHMLAIKAFSESGTSADSTSYQVLKGVDWAISQGARIINMSFAGPRDLMLERTLQTAHDKGIVLIAAAGNAGPKSPPLYPGADPNVIAVTATNANDQSFAAANRGKYIAVAAPGVDILVPAPGKAYQMTTGTSVAAAHVSGIVALLLGRSPTLKPDEIRTILTSTAKDLGDPGRDDQFGWGLIDPDRALDALDARTSKASEAEKPVTR